MDRGTTDKTTKKKKPRRLGMYREGKSMMEKIVKETFITDDEEEVKKVDKVIEDVVDNTMVTTGDRGSINYRVHTTEETEKK
mgnify:FL=1